MRIKRAAFLVNLSSGRGRGNRRYLEALRWLSENSLKKPVETDFFFSETSDENSAFNLARKICKEGYDVLVVIGGDGTLNEAVNGLLSENSEIPVLVVSGGSSNDFAKALLLPEKTAEILDLLERGVIDSVDLGRVNGTAFVNIFGVGVVAEVVRSAERIKSSCWPLIPNILIYFVVLLRQLCLKIDYPHIFLRKKRNKNLCEEMIGKVTLLMVSNGYSCGGVFKFAPGADVKDGLLDICFIKKISRRRIIRFLWRAIKGSHLSLHEVKTDAEENLPKASYFTIASADGKNIPSQMDGEFLLPQKRYEVSVLSKRLRVLVPAKPAAVQEPLVVKTKAPEFQPA